MASHLHANWALVRDAEIYVPNHLSGGQREKIAANKEYPVGRKVVAEGGSRRFFCDAAGGAFMVLRSRPRGRATLDPGTGVMKQGWEALVAIKDPMGSVVVRGMDGKALSTAVWASHVDLDAALLDPVVARRSGLAAGSPVNHI